MWLYGFMTNVRSCRKLEAACRDQIPYLWLTGWQHPDHNTLWRFYQGHRQGMRELFKRTVRTAVSLELVDLAMQAVDGTKMAANAAARWTYTGEQLHQLLARVEPVSEVKRRPKPPSVDSRFRGNNEILSCITHQCIVLKSEIVMTVLA